MALPAVMVLSTPLGQGTYGQVFPSHIQCPETSASDGNHTSNLILGGSLFEGETRSYVTKKPLLSEVEYDMLASGHAIGVTPTTLREFMISRRFRHHRPDVDEPRLCVAQILHWVPPSHPTSCTESSVSCSSRDEYEDSHHVQAIRNVASLRVDLWKSNQCKLLDESAIKPSVPCLTYPRLAQDVHHYFSQHDIPDQLTLLQMIQDAVGSLHLLHRANLIHRDVSPCNLMLTTNKQVCLIDFGFVLPEWMTNNDVSYCEDTRPPELIAEGQTGQLQLHGKRMVARGPATCRSDVWALGVSILFMLSGGQTFRFPSHAFEVSSNRTDVPRQAIETRSIALHYIEKWLNEFVHGPSPGTCEAMFLHLLCRLVSCMLVPEPMDRFTTTQLLSHQFFVSFITPSPCMPAVESPSHSLQFANSIQQTIYPSCTRLQDEQHVFRRSTRMIVGRVSSFQRQKSLNLDSTVAIRSSSTAKRVWFENHGGRSRPPSGATRKQSINMIQATSASHWLRLTMQAERHLYVAAVDACSVVIVQKAHFLLMEHIRMLQSTSGCIVHERWAHTLAITSLWISMKLLDPRSMSADMLLCHAQKNADNVPSEFRKSLCNEPLRMYTRSTTAQHVILMERYLLELVQKQTNKYDCFYDIPDQDLISCSTTSDVTDDRAARCWTWRDTPTLT